MVPSMLVSLFYKEKAVYYFAISIVITAIAGFILYRLKAPNQNIYARDGFAITALGWLSVTVFGALPFLISGSIPSVIDAFFETASGFTTTGASILREVESLPKGILFWRSFTHWMGGMGVLVLMIAVLPSTKANAVYIMKAEASGPSPDKLVPKIRQTAEILYIIYIAITFIIIVLLLLGGMPLFDSIAHAMGTVSTGGFSVRNASIAAYNSVYIETVIILSMLISGINFTLYYFLLKKNVKGFLKNEELLYYIGVIAVAIVLIVANIYGKVYSTIGESLRYASFQVSSLITTTGYVTADFNQWPTLSQMVLLLIMFIGGCAGSTAGGIKCIRILLLSKMFKREITKLNHPRAVKTVRINGHAVDEEILSGIKMFFFVYVAIFAAGVLVISLEGFDLPTTISAVVATLNDIGPGLGLVGPVGNYADFSVLSKVVLSICMMIGRLEVYPILVLLFPSFWKKNTI